MSRDGKVVREISAGARQERALTEDPSCSISVAKHPLFEMSGKKANECNGRPVATAAVIVRLGNRWESGVGDASKLHGLTLARPIAWGCG
jgi:hypothetical protein